MSDPYPVFGSQNLKDDDGAVIDSFFTETDTPPDIRAAIDPTPTPSLPELPKITRLLTGHEILFQAGVRTSPYMLLPADKNRVQLTLDLRSYAATPTVEDFVFFADEVSKMNIGTGTSGTAARLYPSDTPNNLDHHTGAIWILPSPTITGNILITYWSTTS